MIDETDRFPRVLLLAAWGIALLFEGGCAAVAPAARFEPPASPGSVAIVPARYVPASNLVAFATTRPGGAAKGAAVSAGVTGGAFAITAVGATGMGAVALGFIAPFAVIGGAVAGAVAGALEAVPAAQAEAMQASLRESLAQLRFQDALAARFAERATAEASVAVRETRVTGPHAPDEQPSYATAPADTVIEAAVLEVGFETCRPDAKRSWTGGCAVDPANPAVALFLRAQARVVRVSDGTQLALRQWRYASTPRPFGRWMEDGGQVLLDGFERGLRELAQRMVDDLLLAAPIELPNFRSDGHLPGSDPLYGSCWLAPLHPRAQPVLLSEALQSIVARLPRNTCAATPLHFATVDSLQPTLRWSAFPRDIDRQRLDVDAIAGIARVSYDVRVWEAEGCERGRLVVHRSRLSQPAYRPDEPLLAGRRYFWSFRARFTMQGREAATPWSLFDASGCTAAETPEWQYHRFATPALR